MDIFYDFIIHQQDQLVSFAHRESTLRSCQERRFNPIDGFINKCGDALIEFGLWMKRVASSPTDENSVGIYSRN